MNISVSNFRLTEENNLDRLWQIVSGWIKWLWYLNTFGKKSSHWISHSVGWDLRPSVNKILRTELRNRSLVNIYLFSINKVLHLNELFLLNSGVHIYDYEQNKLCCSIVVSALRLHCGLDVCLMPCFRTSAMANSKYTAMSVASNKCIKHSCGVL